MSLTEAPSLASSHAAARPITPAPTIATSQDFIVADFSTALGAQASCLLRFGASRTTRRQGCLRSRVLLCLWLNEHLEFNQWALQILHAKNDDDQVSQTSNSDSQFYVVHG